MRDTLSIVGLTLAGLLLVGCEPVDYYPNHEALERTGDIHKAGPGPYGGNNSNFPVGTPGTPGTTQPITPSASAALPVGTPASSGPTFNLNGRNTFSETASYTGANTGGAAGSDQTNTPGAGVTGSPFSVGR